MHGRRSIHLLCTCSPQQTGAEAVPCSFTVDALQARKSFPASAVIHRYAEGVLGKLGQMSSFTRRREFFLEED
jgi:hypothetical protein